MYYNETVLIQSDTENCNGFKGQLRMRYFGRIRQVANEAEVEEEDDILREKEVWDVYQLYVLGLEPNSYALEYFLELIRGENLQIEYKDRIFRFQRFKDTVRQDIDKSKRWFIRIELETISCTTKVDC